MNKSIAQIELVYVVDSKVKISQLISPIMKERNDSLV